MRSPRTLVISGYGFGQNSGGPITLSNLFYGWHKDALAIICSDPNGSDASITPNTYHATRSIRIPGIGLRYELRTRSELYRDINAMGSCLVMHGPKHRLRQVLGEFVRRLGVIGIFESFPIKADMDRFIRHFNPEVIYTHPGNIAFASLALEVHRKYRIPIVVHIMDDLPNVLFQEGYLSGFCKRRMYDLLFQLCQAAFICMGISRTMCQEYSEKFGKDFLCFHNPVNPVFLKRNSGCSRTMGKGNVLRISYVGRVGWGVSESLLDICKAVDQLNSEGMHVIFDIYVNDLSLLGPLFPRIPGEHGIINFREAPKDPEGIADVLQDSSILVLPVDFDEKSIAAIRLSMPTKIPAYLASGKPVLLYGPTEVGFVRDAMEGKWALVVNRRSLKDLTKTIGSLCSDAHMCNSLLGKASLKIKEFDAEMVRAKFRSCLEKTAGNQTGSKH
jgi:hypothetical protein